VTVPGGTMDSTARLTVFISYSRQDSAFADRLVQALEDRDISALIDRRDLPTLEDWERELIGFIRAADTVVCLISPHWASSRACNWEVDQVRLASKRLAPVVIEPIEGLSLSEDITKINYLFMTDDSQFERCVDQLARALKTDLGWLKEHTRISERARLWQERGKPADLLMRGRELNEADAWAAGRPREAPMVSADQQEFLITSRTAEAERQRVEAERQRRSNTFQRRTIWSLSALAIIFVLGLLAALIQYSTSAKREAQVLTSLAQHELQEGRFDQAIRLAVYGLPSSLSAWLTSWSGDLDGTLAGGLMMNQTVARFREGRVYSGDLDASGTRILLGTCQGEARVWDTEAKSFISVLALGDGCVEGAVFSDDGQRIIAVEGDKVRVWNAASGTVEFEADAAPNHVMRVALSSGGRRAMIATVEGHVSVWDVETKSRIAALELDAELFVAVMSPDGRRVFAADNLQKRKKTLWDVESGKAVSTFDDLALSGIISAAFSRDSAKLVTSGNDLVVRVWDSEMGNVVQRLVGNTSVLSAVEFNKDATLVASADGDVARIWSVQSGEALAVLAGHKGRVYGATFSADGSLLATASEDRTARVWRWQDQSVVSELHGDTAGVVAARFDPSARFLLTFATDGTARFWNIQAYGPAATIETGVQVSNQTSTFIDTAISADGTRVALVTPEGAVNVWEPARGASPLSISHGQPVQSVAFSPDGRMLAIGGRDGTVVLWGLETNKAALELKGHGLAVMSMDFSSDGNFLATGSYDKSARVWDLSHPSDPKVFSLDSPITHVKLSDAADRILIQTATSSWTVRRVSDGQVLMAHVPSRFADINGELSPDGTRVATSSNLGPVQIWDVDSGAEIRVLWHNASTNRVAFSPDGKTIATSGDGVRLWRANGSVPFAILQPDVTRHFAYAVQFSRDGKSLLAASDGEPIARVWDVGNAIPSGAALRAAACDGLVADEGIFSEGDVRDPALVGLERTDVCASVFDVGYWTPMLWRWLNDTTQSPKSSADIGFLLVFNGLLAALCGLIAYFKGRRVVRWVVFCFVLSSLVGLVAMMLLPVRQREEPEPA